MSDERKRPFSCGTDYMDWTESNCEQCIAHDDCTLELALGMAYVGDGKVSRLMAELIGCDGIWPKPCTLRHHKNDPSKTRQEVLDRVEAALTPTEGTK